MRRKIAGGTHPFVRHGRSVRVDPAALRPIDPATVAALEDDARNGSARRRAWAASMATLPSLMRQSTVLSRSLPGKDTTRDAGVCWISRYFGIHRVDYHGHPTTSGRPRPTFGNRSGVLAAVKGSLASRAATRPRPPLCAPGWLANRWAKARECAARPVSPSGKALRSTVRADSVPGRAVRW